MLREMRTETRLTIFFALATLLFGVFEASQWYGREFPSFLATRSNEVGALHQISWKESQELRYHDKILQLKKTRQGYRGQFLRETQIFELDLPARKLLGNAYFSVVVLPLAAAFIYFLSAFLLYRYHLGLPHRNILFYFNLSFSIYLASLFDFHAWHFLSLLTPLSFLAISLLMFQLAFHFPAPIKGSEKLNPYLMTLTALGFLLGIPYIFFFLTKHASWKFWENLLILYAAFGFILWLIRLFLLSRKPLGPFILGLSRYLFWGNLMAFLIPCLFGATYLLTKQQIPINIVIPFTLIFPFSMMLATLLATLSDSRTRLIQSENLAALGSLTSGLAHELNNPLNLISANLSLLKEYLQFMKSSADAPEKLFRDRLSTKDLLQEMPQITEDMELGLHRAQEMMGLLKGIANPKKTAPETFIVSEVVRESLKFLAPKYPDIQTVISTDILPKAQLKLSSTVFLEILLNLIANARDALPKTCPPKSIRIHFRSEGAWAHLGVIDQGSGIPAETLSRIRDPFFTTKPPGKGLGLGLSLIERWVRDFHGKLEIISKMNQGTQIWIQIPQ